MVTTLTNSTSDLNLLEVISNNDKKTSRRTVMVCDDEADLLLMFEIQLRLKYDVLTVDSGKNV